MLVRRYPARAVIRNRQTADPLRDLVGSCHGRLLNSVSGEQPGIGRLRTGLSRAAPPAVAAATPSTTSILRIAAPARGAWRRRTRTRPRFRSPAAVPWQDRSLRARVSTTLHRRGRPWSARARIRLARSRRACAPGGGARRPRYHVMRRTFRTRRHPVASTAMGSSVPRGSDHFRQESIRPRARPGTCSTPGLPSWTLTSNRRPPGTSLRGPGGASRPGKCPPGIRWRQETARTRRRRPRPALLTASSGPRAWRRPPRRPPRRKRCSGRRFAAPVPPRSIPLRLARKATATGRVAGCPSSRHDRAAGTRPAGVRPPMQTDIAPGMDARP